MRIRAQNSFKLSWIEGNDISPNYYEIKIILHLVDLSINLHFFKSDFIS